MRSVVAIFGVLCVALVSVVERLGTVLQLSMSLSSVTNGPLLGIFTMGVLMPWVHGTGALTGGVTGLVTMAWLCFKAQSDIATGQLKFETKPVSTKECSYVFVSTAPMSMLASNITETLPPDE
jgi:solute carrier family 5 (sodium-coupled monocarboxylate transporter), member 8/12